jgi:hypothetical protein
MTTKQYFALFELFDSDPADFIVRVQQLRPVPSDADRLVHWAKDKSLTENQRLAAVGVLAVHFKDRLDIKIEGSGELSPETQSALVRLQNDVKSRSGVN